MQVDPGPPREKVRVIAGTQNGYLLEMEYVKNYIPPTPIETFDPISYWHNGADFNYLPDNRVVDVDPGPGLSLRVIVSQFLETLAIVPPLGF